MGDRNWPRLLDQHLAFLRMTVVELRRHANDAPGMAFYLRHMADQLEGEGTDLAEHRPDRREEPDRQPKGFV